MTFTLKTLPIPVVSASWSGLGILLITQLGYLVYEQALDWRAIVGLLLILAGVLLVNRSLLTSNGSPNLWLIPARRRCVFQLAGGLRDHYTSRAEFILFAKANQTFFARHVGGGSFWQVTL